MSEQPTVALAAGPSPSGRLVPPSEPAGAPGERGRGQARTRSLLLAAALAGLALAARPWYPGYPGAPVSGVGDVRTDSAPGLDGLLLHVARRLDAAQAYPVYDTAITRGLPASVHPRITLRAERLLVIEVSQDQRTWRSMTHEIGKPWATTLVTIRRAP